ncbi:MAG: glycolate oxidase subunit GlcE [Betaproteobacteria bacterium]|nr:glycolate oxidase subunit GlcE [Betaproteobacteria bacterium]
MCTPANWTIRRCPGSDFLDPEFSKGFSDQIRAAAAERRALRIRGGGTKDFYGNEPRGELLDTRGCSGIVAYEPSELVVTARCGTLLADLIEVLFKQGQFLPFEPPGFGPGATLGGCVAAGLSGPRRASAGAVRDFMLGATILDGRGRMLAFGGQVMKNVAGYDVSRVLAGSLGTLGLILEISLKLAPRPVSELTLALEMPQAKALESMNRWAGQPLPISATAWRDGAFELRLSGAQGAVRAAADKLGGERVDSDSAARFWAGIREQSEPFFALPAPLWRLSLPSRAPQIELPGEQLIEWGGALRWLKSGADAATVRAAAAGAGGHATQFRASDKPGGAFAPLPPELARLHRELKQTFDPAGILNPGRLYQEF